MKRALVVLMVWAAAISFSQAQTMQLKLGHFASETYPGSLASKMFAEGVEQQRIIREESVKAGNWMRAALRNAEVEQIEKMKQLGVPVTYPDRSKFKAMMKPAYDRMSAITGEENIQEFLQMVETAK